MTDTGMRSLMAAIIERAVRDINIKQRTGEAYRFLRSERAGEMLQELNIDQKTVLREARRIIERRGLDLEINPTG